MTDICFGGSGFVGDYLNRVHTVANFDLKQGLDIRDYEQVRTAIELYNPDRVFILAAQAYVPESSYNPLRGLDVNVKGAINVLEAIRQTGSRARVLFTSTSEAVGYDCDLHNEITLPNPSTPYGASKLAAEHYCMVYNKLYGIPVVVTRAFNHTGPGHQPIYAIPALAKRVAEVEAGKAEYVVHGDLNARRAYLDVRDVVEAYQRVIDAEPGVYNVANEQAVSIQWILETLIEMTGKEISTKLDPSLARGNASDHFPVVRAAKLRALGWEPKYTLKETLADVLNYWRERV